ncbi:MAG: hypothetical protein M1833_004360 [Piccolia ochrophora]|nr:MAG: hypothetical protein M1833_004360 [Piccolia ochrophora]
MYIPKFLVYLGPVISLQATIHAVLFDSTRQQDVIAYTDIREKLKDGDIIPNLIDDFTPSFKVEIGYPDASVDFGNKIDPSKVQDIPDDVSLGPLGSTSPADTTYTLVLTDPDAPSHDNPKWSQVCHWVATNISFSSADEFHILSLHHGPRKLEKGKGLDELVEYMAPAPPPKTGPHRYVFLLFASESGKSGSDLSKPEGRKRWGTGEKGYGVREWAKENNLAPVGGNYFKVENSKQ